MRTRSHQASRRRFAQTSRCSVLSLPLLGQVRTRPFKFGWSRDAVWDSNPKITPKHRGLWMEGDESWHLTVYHNRSGQLRLFLHLFLKETQQKKWDKHVISDSVRRWDNDLDLTVKLRGYSSFFLNGPQCNTREVTAKRAGKSIVSR